MQLSGGLQAARMSPGKRGHRLVTGVPDDSDMTTGKIRVGAAPAIEALDETRYDPPHADPLGIFLVQAGR
jgi:hypothetical protein